MSTPTQVDPRNDDASADGERTFPPSPEFVADAVAHPDLHDAAAADRPGFWGEQARTLLDWRTPFTQTLDWSNAPFATWFADGDAQRRRELPGPPRPRRQRGPGRDPLRGRPR